MSQQTAPFIEGKWGWSYGESGWNIGMDENLLKFSFLFDANIDGIVSSLPSAVNGQSYFLTTDNRFYFAVNNTWYSSPVPDNFQFYVKSTNQAYKFDLQSNEPVQVPSTEDLEAQIMEVVQDSLNPSNIKSLYESNSNTNAFTDLEKTRTSSAPVYVNQFITQGMTNHSIAFQAALDTGARKIVFDGRQEYNLATVVNIRSDLLIDLCGARINVTAGSIITSPIYGVDVENVNIVNGSIYCDNKAISGIRIYSNTVGCKSIRFNGLRIYGTLPDPTLQYGGIEVASLQGLAGAQNSDISITDCDFNNLGTHGVLVYNTNGVTFNSNRVNGAQNHGMEAVACRNVTIDGNRVENCLISALGVGAGTDGFVISNNFARNCAGDGTYTVEHNSINGVVEGNVGLDCNTSGINVSHGESGLISSDRLRNIAVRNNILRQKAGVTNYIGINVYGQDSFPGTSITVMGNSVDGFSRPIEYAYFEDGAVIGNTIDNYSGTLNFAIKATYVRRTKIEQNICSSDTTQHTYQLINYNSLQCDGVSVKGNSTIASGGGSQSLVYIEGNGTHQVGGNSTQGSSHYIQSNANATIFATVDAGALTGTPYAGVVVLGAIVGPVSASASQPASNPASPLPANPAAYITIYSPSLGNLKIPAYAL